MDVCMSVKTMTAPAATGPGRPSDYDEAIAKDICDRIANGDLPARICSQAGYPSRSTLYRWRQQHPEFDRAYVLAVAFWVWSLEEECLEIADNLATAESVERVKIRLAERHAMIARRTQDRTSVGRAVNPKKGRPPG
jgi:hypothetical protein